MLRALLYLGEEPAVATAKLNDILASNGLLTGFATLFAAVYDPARRSLTYVSCGQEPGLLLRAATGQVENLRPTGPVLGAFAGSQFTQRFVLLETGDILAVFTDGLTEAGLDRRNMLGVEGITGLLMEDALEPRTASSVVRRLMSGVEAFATAAGIRDDVCLLVARVDGEVLPVAALSEAHIPQANAETDLFDAGGALPGGFVSGQIPGSRPSGLARGPRRRRLLKNPARPVPL